MKVLVIFVLFFAMMFSLELYLDRLEQDINNTIPQSSIATNETKSPSIYLSSYFNSFQF